MPSTAPSSRSNVVPLALVTSALLAFTSLRLSQQLSRAAGLAVATAGVTVAVLVMLVLVHLAVRQAPGQ
jgi:hypothetical protein